MEDLRNLKLPDGTSFVKTDMSDKDLQKAIKAIQDLCKAREDLASRGSQAVTLITASADRQWGAWFWIKNKIQEAYEWAVEKVGAAYKFVVKIAGKVWEFIVENFPQIAAVIQKILEVISKGWEWVKNKFEEIFPWKDILSVKNALVNITTAGVIMGSDIFADLEKKADKCFDDLHKKVRDLKNKTLPKELADIRISKDPPMPVGLHNEKISDLMKSPQMQYGVYHLRHSSSKQSDSSVIGSRSEGETSFDRLYKRLSGIWDSVIALAVRFGANIVDLFSNKEFSLDVLIAKIGLEFAEDALRVIRKAVTALLGSLGDLLLELADAMNAKINISVIGPLYSKLTQGSRFTALDVVCLLLAIPSTIAYKAIKGSLPKEDKGYQQLVQPDVMKGALDLRIGRIKSGEVLSKSDKGTASVQMMNLHKVDERPHVFNETSSQQVKGKTSNETDRDIFHQGNVNKRESAKFLLNQPSGIRKMNESTALQMSMINFQHAQGDKTQFNDTGISGEAVDQAIMHKTRGWWVEVGKPACKMLAVFIPVASGLYTVGYTLPKARLAGQVEGADGGNGVNQARRSRASFKLVMKLVFWFGHGALICLPKLNDTKKDFWILAEAAFNDVVFGWKFIIRAIPSLLPIGGHLINEYAGCCAEAVAGITQTIGLIAMHVDVYAIAKASYPWYMCPEEYIDSTAKVAVAVAIMLQCNEPWSLGFAFGLTSVGSIWSHHRMSDELKNNRDDDEIKCSAIDYTV